MCTHTQTESVRGGDSEEQCSISSRSLKSACAYGQVEAYEVEQQQMLRQEVIKREGDYNFDMHVYRTLVTNLFPADYDYEASQASHVSTHTLQTRHTGSRERIGTGTGCSSTGAPIQYACVFYSTRKMQCTGVLSHPAYSARTGAGAESAAPAVRDMPQQGPLVDAALHWAPDSHQPLLEGEALRESSLPGTEAGHG